MVVRTDFAAGEVLAAQDLDDTFASKLGVAILINAQTGTTYTLVLADQGKLVTAANASAITITVPPNSSVAFPVGTQIGVMQTGAGQVTLAAGAGVTLNSYNSAKKIVGNGGMAVCIKTATNTWQLSGALVV